MNRRTFIKRLFGSFFTLASVTGGTYYYARDIEPNLLTVHKEVINSKRLPKQFNNYRIVHFSDTHIGFQYTVKQLRKLAETVNSLGPDLIIFTGDLIDQPDRYNWNPQLIDTLQQFQAKDKLWIYGNHDHGGNGTAALKNIMSQAGFTLLLNEHCILSRGQDQITIAGIDDMSLGQPDIDAALHHAPSNQFTILLSHAPDFADIAKTYPIDLQFSGHSHGGQIRLPFIGSMITPSYARKYIRGKYTLNHDGKQMELFVNSGIGTTRLPYRFLCEPEIHFYTLTHLA